MCACHLRVISAVVDIEKTMVQGDRVSSILLLASGDPVVNVPGRSVKIRQLFRRNGPGVCGCDIEEAVPSCEM